MLFEELPEQLDSLREKLIREMQERVLFAAAIEMKGEMIDRIFNKGKMNDGASIGKYKEYETYVPKEKFVRTGAFVKRGKENEGDFQNGKERKTMFFKDGWGGVRAAQGRQKEYKDFRYSGSLERSIQVVRIGDIIVVAITDSFESKKRQGLEAQQNATDKIFPAGQGDFVVFKESVDREIEFIASSL